MLTTGELLKKEREKKGLTLADIEKKTKIRQKYLIAIENTDWSSFPSKTYILGVLKTYGKTLQLDEEKLTAFFRREYAKNEDVAFKKRLSKKYFAPEVKQLFRMIIIIIIAIFSVYFSYQLKIYLAPPKLEIISPTKSAFVREQKIELIGKTEKDTIVTVNGERVFLDDNNMFKTTIPLGEGQFSVTIEATGANGKKTVLQRNFIRKQ